MHLRQLTFMSAVLGVSGSIAFADGTWHPVTSAPAFLGTMELMSDGTVLAQGSGTSNTWYKLTPNSFGSYASGTWSQAASMSLQRQYMATNILTDGRMMVLGGEYSGSSGTANWTNTGEIYNPVTNTWTSITAPSGWTHIGDAQSVVLSDGTFMLGNCGYAGTECSPFQMEQALLDETTLTWTITGSGKADQNSEEGWARVKPFVQAHNVNYAVLMGDDQVAKRYDIQALPLTYLIDKRGRIAAAYAGIVDRDNVEANIQIVLKEPNK